MVFCENLEHPESPVPMADGSWLIVQMKMGNGCVSRVSSDGKNVTTIKETGRPNAVLAGKQGDMWVAESWEPSLVNISEDGSARVIARGNHQGLFLWPNDLAWGPDGAIYLTDSGIAVHDLLEDDRVKPDAWHKPMAGKLYRIDPDTEQVDCLDSGFQFTNGIAFGPDGGLYVAEMVTGHIFRYDFTDRLEINSKTLFASVIDKTGPQAVVGPDGITFDKDGNLYAALFGQGHVAVVSPSGHVVKRLVTQGACPTNLAFSRDGKLYVTEFQKGQIEVLQI